MSTITWIPGTNQKLDKLFDELREKQYLDKSHRLWKNYSKTEFEFLKPVALSIAFDGNKNPIACSSIAARDCWPENVYRIHNRTWKIQDNRKLRLSEISPSMASICSEQIAWLHSNTDCALYFISRQGEQFENWMIKNFAKHGLNFYTDNFKYLTCPNEIDSSCWQKIIFNGDTAVLRNWKRCLVD